MAAAAARGPGRRLVEWGIVGSVLVLLLLVFLQQSRTVQGQAELASVRATLATLRTGAVLRHIEAGRAGRAPDVAFAQRNPFLAEGAMPSRYLGERDARTLGDGAIGWYFDPACDCVGYRPGNPRWITAPEGSTELVYRIVRQGGMLLYEPMAAYRWQDEALQ